MNTKSIMEAFAYLARWKRETAAQGDPSDQSAFIDGLKSFYKEGEFLKAVSKNPAVYAQKHFDETLPQWTKSVVAHMRQFKAPDGKIFAFEVGENITARLAILHGIIVQHG